MTRTRHGHQESRTQQNAHWLDRHGRHGAVDVPAPPGQGLPATVYNRTRDKAQPLLDAGRDLGRHAQGGGRALRRGVRHRRLSQGRARGLSRRRTVRWPAVKRRHDPGGHDHERAIAGARNPRGGQGEGRLQPRRAGIRRRRGREERGAVDHGRRRQSGRWKRYSPCSSAWARRSCIRGRPGRASTPRW